MPEDGLYSAEWRASDLTELLSRLGMTNDDAAAAVGVDPLELKTWSDGYSPAPKAVLIALTYLVSNERARMAALAHRDVARAADQWLVVPKGQPLSSSMSAKSCAEALETYHLENSQSRPVELWHAAMVRAEPESPVARVLNNRTAAAPDPR
jgi:hypothetical protein